MVFVAESLPGGEGVELARQLRRAGRSVSLVPDSGLAWAIRESDAVLVGADAVTLDPCLFNKVGSLYAALAASRFGKPFIPVFESYKIHPVVKCSIIEVEVRVYRVDGWGDIVYRVFDRVEGDLVSAALTEYGLVDFEPNHLRDVVDRFLSIVIPGRDQYI